MKILLPLRDKDKKNAQPIPEAELLIRKDGFIGAKIKSSVFLINSYSELYENEYRSFKVENCENIKPTSLILFYNLDSNQFSVRRAIWTELEPQSLSDCLNFAII